MTADPRRRLMICALAGVMTGLAMLPRPAGAESGRAQAATEREVYQRHTLKLTLKNFLHVTKDRRDEFRYRSINAPVLAVHPHIVLSLAGGRTYVDDGFDVAGNDYHLYLVFQRHQLASLLTLAPDLKPTPLHWLTPGQAEILRASIREAAQSGCQRTLPQTASTAELARFDLGPCIKNLFAAR